MSSSVANLDFDDSSGEIPLTTRERRLGYVSVAELNEQYVAVHPDAGTFPFPLASLVFSTAEQSVRLSAYLVVKRFMDIVGSLVGILLFGPVMLLIATIIKLTDWGPVFYIHDRVGAHGKPFRCLKFRTMITNADKIQDELSKENVHSDNRTFKIPNDPRVTWVGRWIRRASLDELPQLFNVLWGHMSIVGPRPPVPSEVVRYSLTDLQRLAVKPGITCIWQVSGRSRIPFPQQLEMDLEYIQRRSILLDMWLICKTFPAVFTADGAY